MKMMRQGSSKDDIPKINQLQKTLFLSIEKTNKKEIHCSLLIHAIPLIQFQTGSNY